MFLLLFLFNGAVFSQLKEKRLTEQISRNCRQFYQNRVGELEYQYCVNSTFNDAAQRDEIVIDYTVRNLGKKNYAVYDGGAYKNYFIEQPNEAFTEINLKAFTGEKPSGAVCPTEYQPMSRISRLKKRQSVSGQISVPLPLQLDYPYYKCLSNPPKISKNNGALKICLGVARINHKKLEKRFSKEALRSKNTLFNVRSENWKSAAEDQQLLCSETLELK